MGHQNLSIDSLVCKAQNAAQEYLKLTQQDVDKISKAMADAAFENAEYLAELAVAETKRGNIPDKIIKNKFASAVVYESIKNIKTVGVLKENSSNGYLEIAEPVGVVAGITPITNPTSTVIFKAIICAKTRNPIIFAFHPGAQESCVATAKILKQAAVKAGAPSNCISWIEAPSIDATTRLMNREGVNIVLATGGSDMVKAAYSTGKPALGVGPGNVPCYVESSADLTQACKDIVSSKTFDNGMICASEQSVVVDAKISKDFEKEMVLNGCVFLNAEQIHKLSKLVVNDVTHMINPFVVGKTAFQIAQLAGIDVPENTKILVAHIHGVGNDFPLSIEKLSPILAYYVTDTIDEAISLCGKILSYNGLGHTAVIHSKNDDLILEFSKAMNVSRVVVNSPSSQGAIGGLYNVGVPSMTLGCGAYGKNSTSDNVSVSHLLNIKRIYYRKENPLTLGLLADS